jgi:hypothetical protein
MAQLVDHACLDVAATQAVVRHQPAPPGHLQQHVPLWPLREVGKAGGLAKGVVPKPLIFGSLFCRDPRGIRKVDR